MAFFGSIWRARRGDFNLFLIAALVALVVVPGASQSALPPQSYEIVLFWLQSETATAASPPVARAASLLAVSHQKVEAAPQKLAENLSVATLHCGQFSTRPTFSARIETPTVPTTPALERHVAALLSGVRTNRWLI